MSGCESAHELVFVIKFVLWFCSGQLSRVDTFTIGCGYVYYWVWLGQVLRVFRSSIWAKIQQDVHAKAG